ncbi:unnamed protein product [Effrenium voratum]|uniref:Meiotic nuclear division protein 1 homolog n=1 Tax=Effrenium voratum TaxID=2562239 RepID=A0AA36I2W2_9DINO|nr:unnamed protein product [Effrenium voratum]
MSKRKGLSFDEKKSTLLSAMQAEAAFFTLKELETLGKSKGVIPQAVKEVVESLVADDEVQSDKVGSQILFWALPSQRTATLQNKRQKLQAETNQLQSELQKLQAELAQLSSQSAPTEEEAATLRAQALLERKKCEQLRSEIQAYERCGPAKLAEMKKQTAIAKEAANRWADNICAVRSLFLRERRGEVSAVQFNQTFGLPEDFDYLE